jgi:signal transduction histidine kinase
MIKNIIVLHGGTIDVESRAGAGTTFTFELPAAGPGYGGRGTH